jgi:tetratricopeptide (TPR) repeat protein
MVRVLLIVFSIFVSNANAQDVNALLKEALNFEYKFKDAEALEKYKQVITLDAKNEKALVKAADLSSAIGARQTDKSIKTAYYTQALNYATQAVSANNKSADAYVSLATANGKMTEVETENKKVVAFVKEVKINADNALSINPNHAMANFIEGKWHYEMVSLNWAKKLAVKTLYGGLPTASLEKAAEYLEKSKTQDPYFVLTYLTLAKVYKEKSSPIEMIEILNKLVKLPRRTIDDAAYIEEGKKMLQDNQ